MTFSIGIAKNGSEWHPGCFDQELSMVLTISGLKKNLQEWDMLHLQATKLLKSGWWYFFISVSKLHGNGIMVVAERFHVLLFHIHYSRTLLI